MAIYLNRHIGKAYKRRVQIKVINFTFLQSTFILIPTVLTRDQRPQQNQCQKTSGFLSAHGTRTAHNKWTSFSSRDSSRGSSK